MMGPVVAVDDDPVDLELLRRCFARSRAADGCEFVSFQNGRLFLDHMAMVASGRAVAPSVVLMDVNMPGLSGFEVVRELHRAPTPGGPPRVLFLSNSDLPEDVAEADALGCSLVGKFTDLAAAIAFFDSLVG